MRWLWQSAMEEKIGDSGVNILHEAENLGEVQVLQEIPENRPFPKGIKECTVGGIHIPKKFSESYSSAVQN